MSLEAAAPISSAAPRRPVPRVDPDRCAPSARRRADPLIATAAPATRWLLVEQPGAWGRHALRQSLLGGDVAVGLLEMTLEQGVRIQVIRRPPHRTHADRPRRWAYVDSGAPTPTSWWGEYYKDAELLALSLDGAEGSPSLDPIFLVCTHARHDACCALFGRPAYSALARRYPESTWETSHVGGDRFAANVVILPGGHYYGGLDGDSALRVITAHSAGQIEPAYYRGASSQAVPTQAAEHYLREYLGEFRIGAVVSLDLQQVDLSRWIARLAHADGAEFVLEVSATHGTSLNRLTCSASHPAASRSLELNSLRELRGG
ncbi:MAG: sucrase ferredoxin [Geodermatophilaceae bacterium]